MRAFLVAALLCLATSAHAIPYQIQLTGKIDTGVEADFFTLDLFDASRKKIDQLRNGGANVICYFSAGSWENWRSDASRFPASVKGRGNGWPGEKWLDVRRLDILAPIMRARLDLAKAKKCWGVDPDNVDGYSNRTGFPLTAADQIKYNLFLATEAHARGLKVGLKNDLEQADELQPAFDFITNEECFDFRECDLLQPFVAAGKPAFVIQYEKNPSRFCPQALSQGLIAVKKRLNLDAWIQSCG